MHQERLVALSFSFRHFAEGFNYKSRDEFQFAIGTDKTRLFLTDVLLFLSYLPDIFVHHTMSGLFVPHVLILPDHQYTALLLSVSLHWNEKDLC